MKPSFVASFVFLSLLAARSVLSQDQQEPIPASDQEALSIAARSAQALGVQQVPIPVLARGKVTYLRSKEEAAFELTVVSPRVFKTVAHRSDSDAVFVSNHHRGYLSHAGVKRGLGYVNQFGARCPFLSAFGFLGELNAPGLALKLLPVNEGEPYRIKASYLDSDDPEMADLSVVELEVDPTTFLPVKLKTIVRPPANQQIQIPVEYRYESYRKAGPFLLPSVVRIFAEGQPHSVVTFDTFEVNPAVNSADFEVE